MTSACPFVHNNPLLYPAGVAVRLVRAGTVRRKEINRELDVLKKYDEELKRRNENCERAKTEAENRLIEQQKITNTVVHTNAERYYLLSEHDRICSCNFLITIRY